MKRHALLSACIFAVSLQAQTLSLKAAQEALLANNRDIAAAEAEIRRAAAGVDEAKSGRYPSLDASASYRYITEKSKIHMTVPVLGSLDNTIGQNSTTEFGLDLTYPVFTGFAREHSILGRRKMVVVKELELDGLKSRLSLSLGLLYIQWQLSYRQAGIRRVLIAQMETYARQVGDQRDAGIALKSRLLDAQARLALAQVDLRTDIDRCDSLKRELLSLLHSNDAPVTPDSSDGIIDTADLPRAVVPDRAEIAALNHRREEIVQTRQALDGQKYPALAGIAGYRYANPGLNMGLDEFMGYGIVGAQLKWNLFDGFRRRSQSAQLKLAEQQIDIARDQQADKFQRLFDEAHAQVVSAQERLAAAGRAHEAARALADELTTLLAAGVVTSAEQLAAATAEQQAALLVEQARALRTMAFLKLKFAAGVKIVY